MNSEVIKNAIGTPDKLLNRAKRAIWEIERDLYGDPGYGEVAGYADPDAAMGATLEEIHDVLLVVLEAAAMPETRTSLLKKWPDFTKNGYRVPSTMTSSSFARARRLCAGAWREDARQPS